MLSSNLRSKFWPFSALSHTFVKTTSLTKIVNSAKLSPNYRINNWIKSELYLRTTHSYRFTLNKIKSGRFNRDPQIGAGLRQAQTCNLRSEFRCSMCPAIHTNSRILLRPSSTCEPSDPPLRIFFENSFLWLALKTINAFSLKHFFFPDKKKEKHYA